MKMIFGFIVAVMLGFLPSADAARLPFIEDVLKTEPQTVTQPEPAALGANWWRYFEVQGEELDKRVKSTIERLQALPAELPANMVAAARPFIERTIVNLQALPEARALPSTTAPAPPAYAERFTVRQLLDIEAQLRKARDELQAQRDDVAVAETTIRSARKRIDTLLAAYLGLSPDKPERVLRGLEIMAEQSAIAVAEEKLRVDKAALATDEVLVKQFAEEQAVAATRLGASNTDPQRLNREIEQAQGALRAAQERLVNERSRALDVLGDSPEDKATARYRQQRVTRAAVDEAIATARWLRLKLERQLVDLLLGTADVDTQALRTMLSDWEAQFADIRRGALSWTRDSALERDRAGESIAGAPADGTIATPVRLINDDRVKLAQETLVALQRLYDELNQASLLVGLVNEQLVHREGWLRDWLARAEQALRHLWERVTLWATSSLFKVGDTPVTTLGILRIGLILFIAWLISHWLRRVLNRLGERREGANQSAFYTVGRLSHYLIIIIGIIVGLSSIGIDFTNFALVAGALSIGIGFGLQSIVNNFVSGLILLFERSLKVGDFVELASGVAGEVREINVRSTLINTNDYVDIVVPNSEFMNGKVTNWTLLESYCRIHIPFKVAYGTDKELVRQAGLEAAEKVPHTLSGVPGRNPGVWLVRFGESSLDFELVVWITPRAVKRPGAVHAAYMWEIESALHKYNIAIPYPQRDLHLRTGFQDILQSHPDSRSVAKGA